MKKSKVMFHLTNKNIMCKQICFFTVKKLIYYIYIYTHTVCVCQSHIQYVCISYIYTIYIVYIYRFMYSPIVSRFG